MENIINVDNYSFALIDFRQNFGSMKDIGDIYYDIGKLWHSFYINDHMIKDGHLFVISSESFTKSLRFCLTKIIAMQKQYFPKKILKHSENILIALQYIKKTPLTLWTISRVIGIDQDQ